MIPVFDVLATYKKADKEILAAIKRVLKSGQYILGPEVAAFEKEFAEATGNKYCVGCANGTEAITLALGAVGITGRDEVITANFTAYPTIVGIERSEAKAIVVDVKENALIDEKKIEAAITSRTRAIVPVHLFGNRCNMKAIMKIAKKHKLHVIEDCAQRTFTKIVGDCGAFSFYPTKTLGTFGDGGAVCTDDPKTAERLRALRDYGQTEKNVFTYKGMNSRLDEIHAAILRVKLKRKCFMRKPCVFRDMYRDIRRARYEKAGVATLIHYPYTVNEQEAFDGQKKDQMDQSKFISREILTIPSVPLPRPR